MPVPGQLEGIVVQDPTFTLDYLTTVAAHVCKHADMPAGSVTGHTLRDAGIQVLRHPSGGHCYLYWPGRIQVPQQCFNGLQAGKLVATCEGWEQAVGVKRPAAAAPAAAAPTAAVSVHPEPSSSAADVKPQQVANTAAAGRTRFRASGSKATGSTAATAADDSQLDTQGCLPGYGFTPASKEVFALEAVADRLTAMTNKKFTYMELRALGLRAVKELGSLRRQFSLYWPGITSEVILCTPGYQVGAVKLLSNEIYREKLGVSASEVKWNATGSPPAAAPASSSKRAYAAATAAAAAAAIPVAAQPPTAAAVDEAAGASKRLKQDKGPRSQPATTTAVAAKTASPAVEAAAHRSPSRHVGEAGAMQHVSASAGSNDDVINSVDKVLQQLSDAVHVSSSVISCPSDDLYSLPGAAVLTAHLEIDSIIAFAAQAQALQSDLTADRQVLQRMIAAYSADTLQTAAAASGGGGGDGLTGYRKPLLAFRSALKACVDEADAWVSHSHQKRLLERLTAVCEVKDYVEKYQQVLQQLQDLQQGGISHPGDDQVRISHNDADGVSDHAVGSFGVTQQVRRHAGPSAQRSRREPKTAAAAVQEGQQPSQQEQQKPVAAAAAAAAAHENKRLSKQVLQQIAPAAAVKEGKRPSKQEQQKPAAAAAGTSGGSSTTSEKQRLAELLQQQRSQVQKVQQSKEIREKQMAEARQGEDGQQPLRSSKRSASAIDVDSRAAEEQPPIKRSSQTTAAATAAPLAASEGGGVTAANGVQQPDAAAEISSAPPQQQQQQADIEDRPKQSAGLKPQSSGGGSAIGGSGSVAAAGSGGGGGTVLSFLQQIMKNVPTSAASTQQGSGTGGKEQLAAAGKAGSGGTAAGGRD